MTEPKRILRPRRAAPTSTTDIPPEVVEWFADGCPMRAPPWPVLLPPTHTLVSAWWAEWKRTNPHTRPESAALQLLGLSR